MPVKDEGRLKQRVHDGDEGRLKQRVHDGDHPGQIVAAAEGVKIAGQRLQILTLYVAGSFAPSHGCAGGRPSTNNVRGLGVYRARPCLFVQKCLENGPQVRMGCQRFCPRAVPA